jgi:SOS response regulatory protein OraA/RecX
LQKFSEVEERKKAARLLGKKMKASNQEKEAAKRRDNIYRFLYARGFSKDVITDLIRDVVK